MKLRFFFLLFASVYASHATIPEQRNCIVLLDHDDFAEPLARGKRHFLMTKLQSALAEQAAPILLHTSLFNSFIERRISFEQRSALPDTAECKILQFHHKLQERLAYWSDYYNQESTDRIHNKRLVAQRINQELYEAQDKTTFSDENFQFLLNYLTPFDRQSWFIYTNNKGFYLLIPKKYAAHYSELGFKLDSLQEVIRSDDPGLGYFQSRTVSSIAQVLSDFFVTYDECANMPYSWNIILSGHGGSNYEEINNAGTISWIGQPIIADLTVQEFEHVLDFFNTQVNTNLFHYSTCAGSGNHSEFVFGNGKKKTYSYAIICDSLTDCFSFCKWKTLFPCHDKKFLTPADLQYDAATQRWHFPLISPYRWNNFFTALASINFADSTIEQLPHILRSITFDTIAAISLLCLPGSSQFYPMHGAAILKIDDRLLALANSEKSDQSLALHDAHILLVESCHIPCTLDIASSKNVRFISIKPGTAMHYFKALKTSHYLDLPSAFWQAEGQLYDKIFLIDECTFPHSRDSLLFKNISITLDTVSLKNLLIVQQRLCGIRMFFTLNEKAYMAVAHKTDSLELEEYATIQEVVTLSEAAKVKYEEYYGTLLKKIM